jgi:hypothetical protein
MPPVTGKEGLQRTLEKDVKNNLPKERIHPVPMDLPIPVPKINLHPTTNQPLPLNPNHRFPKIWARIPIPLTKIHYSNLPPTLISESVPVSPSKPLSLQLQLAPPHHRAQNVVTIPLPHNPPIAPHEPPDGQRTPFFLVSPASER